MCCKLLRIEALQKPAHKWCGNCDIGKGCRIYDSRPEECRAFACSYLVNSSLGPEWRPDRSRLMLTSELQTGRLVAYVDPQRPDAWRQDPFHASLRKWSREFLAQGRQVLVDIARRTIVIFPDHTVDLGILTDDDRILTFQEGGRMQAIKLHKDDPRAKPAAAR
jgi:hypothetical protein